MRQLDEDFREAGRIASQAARQPAFDTVRRRAWLLRLRRRALATGAVLALAALSFAGFAALRPAAPGQPADAGPRGLPSTVESIALPEPSGTAAAKPYVSWAGAAGADHVYAVVSGCGTCALRMVASGDGGVTWQPRGVPPAGGRRTTIWSVLGERLLIATTLPSQQRGVERWMTLDGGLTWTAFGLSARPVDRVPDGTRAVDPAAIGAPAGGPALYAVDPAAGVVAPLAVQPPLDHARLVDAPPGAGIWARGRDRSSRRPAVAVSTDGGRTWRRTVLAAEPPALVDDGVFHVATTDGRLVYAHTGDHGQTRLHRSADGGATWERIATLSTAARPAGYVTRDGGYVLAAGDRFVADDGAVDIPGLPGWDLAPRAVAVDSYLSWDFADAYRSADGITWHRLNVL